MQPSSTAEAYFGTEILENARHEMLTLYSMEHLQLANEVLGRST